MSLSTKASLNFSAIDSSVVPERDGDTGLGTNPHTAHVVGLISLTIGSSSAISAYAAMGTSVPRKPKGDGLGLTMMRGHSVAKTSSESLSIFGCKTERRNELESHATAK